MTKGERAIVKEERRQAKERKRRIELANKMLIPTGGKTLETLGLIAFDPEGVFHFNGDRWMKVYEINGAGKGLVRAAKVLSGEIHITFSLSESGRETCHLSLMEDGEIYEDVRRKMSEDEKILSGECNLRALSLDETMNLIATNFYQDVRFSYASYVRGKKDWKKECFFEAKESLSGFSVGRLFGESFTAIAFPEEMDPGLLSDLKGLGCAMYVAITMNALSEEEKFDFKRDLEKKYNRRLPVNEEEDYINLSLSITILCDSDDARQIVEETLVSLFLKYGVLITPAFNNQKRICEGNLSLGLINETLIRNVTLGMAKALMGGEKDGDAKIEIRPDETE